MFGIHSPEPEAHHEPSKETESDESVVEAHQIPVMDESGDPYPDRVQDTEKARAMALAGQEKRNQAAEARARNDEFEADGWARSTIGDALADDADHMARHLEREAGEQYDEQYGHQPTAADSLRGQADYEREHAAERRELAHSEELDEEGEQIAQEAALASDMHAAHFDKRADEAEEEGQQQDQDHSSSAGTSFMDRFTDQDRTSGTEPDGPTGEQVIAEPDEKNEMPESKAVFHNPFPEFQFLGNIREEYSEHGLWDAYIHDQRQDHPDWPKLLAMAVAIRHSDEESDYNYMRLNTFAGASGWRLYKEGWPDMHGNRHRTAIDQVLRMAIGKGLVSEDDLLKTIEVFELKDLDPADQERVLAMHGFATEEEWLADEEAKFKAQRAEEATKRGYSSAEELERAEDERLNGQRPTELPGLPHRH